MTSTKAKTRTTIEVDRAIWATVRQLAYDQGLDVSEAAEALLSAAIATANYEGKV
jgi:post-segregation antitoxin (ccd killing protein)